MLFKSPKLTIAFAIWAASWVYWFIQWFGFEFVMCVSLALLILTVAYEDMKRDLSDTESV